MSKVKINIVEGSGCDPCKSHSDNEAKMHRTTLARLMADVRVLLKIIQDGDDLPEWLETKITKAGDYMSSAARYLAGDMARQQGQLEEKKNCGCGLDPCITYGKIKEESKILDEGICEVSDYFNLYEALQDAIDENGGTPCPQCLYETIVEADNLSLIHI